MKAWLTASILFTFLSAATAYVHAQVPGSRKIGTYPCTNCMLGYPRVDPATANELLLAQDSFNRLVSIQPLWIVPGDVITMCNGAACVDYQVTVGGDGYVGIKYETQTSTTPVAKQGGFWQSYWGLRKCLCTLFPFSKSRSGEIFSPSSAFTRPPLEPCSSAERGLRSLARRSKPLTPQPRR